MELKPCNLNFQFWVLAQKEVDLWNAVLTAMLNGMHTPYLCKRNEGSEICVGSVSGGAYYWGLKGMSNATFRVQPLLPSGDALSAEREFIRNGLLGFLGPGGLVLVCSSRDGLMTVTNLNTTLKLKHLKPH
jgi:hypothetical protein